MSSRKPRVPGYRKHSSGQARVTLDCKDFLLGPYNSPESKEEYRRLIAEWAERKGRFAPAPLQSRLFFHLFPRNRSVGEPTDPEGRQNAARRRDAATRRATSVRWSVSLRIAASKPNVKSRPG